MDTRTFEEIAEGQLSVKLISHNPDGSETWNDYTLHDTNVLLPTEEIAVFDSRIGTYARFNDVAAAIAAQAEHVDRIKALVPVVPEWYHKIQSTLNRKFISGNLNVAKRSDK